MAKEVCWELNVELQRQDGPSNLHDLLTQQTVTFQKTLIQSNRCEKLKFRKGRPWKCCRRGVHY